MLAPTAKAHATVPTPSVGVFWSWTGAGLTLAAVIYGALITALGVVLAPLGGVWRIGYAVVALALLVLGLFIFRDQTIRAMRRYLDWRGRGRVV